MAIKYLVDRGIKTFERYLGSFVLSEHHKTRPYSTSQSWSLSISLFIVCVLSFEMNSLLYLSSHCFTYTCHIRPIAQTKLYMTTIIISYIASLLAMSFNMLPQNVSLSHPQNFLLISVLSALNNKRTIIEFQPEKTFERFPWLEPNFLLHITKKVATNKRRQLPESLLTSSLLLKFFLLFFPLLVLLCIYVRCLLSL